MNKRDITAKLPSKRELTGHVRRARTRLEKSLRGDKSADLIVQAGCGALAAGVIIRLLRTSFPGGVVSRWAPVAVFGILLQYLNDRQD